MTLIQALLYFGREAARNLLRSWKVSLLAISTIAVSLFLAGSFALVNSNLGQLVKRWQAESRIVVYLESTSTAEDFERLRSRLEQTPWIEQVEAIDPETAQQRFLHAFPSMADLLDAKSDDALPASLEVQADRQQIDKLALATWVDQWTSDPAIAMVDDDRDWLEQAQTVVLLFRGLGLLLGTLLVATAVITISSIIRLTAYLYDDEIAVMRQVGATEFFIRGPFYMEGLLQGLFGSLVAVMVLFGTYRYLLARHADSLLTTLLAADFLPPTQALGLIVLGAGAGLVGAVTSLRKESLGGSGEPSGR